MRNFYHTILINIHRIIYYVAKARIWLLNVDAHTDEERYALANEMITKMNRSSGYETLSFGQENLPKDGGYMLYPNHQGKYDVLGIFTSHQKPCSFVMDEKRSHLILVSEFLGLVKGKKIVLNDPRQTLTVFKEMAEELKKAGSLFFSRKVDIKRITETLLRNLRQAALKWRKWQKCQLFPLRL